MSDLWLPQAASSYAADIDGLLVTITWIVGVWFVVAEAVLLYLTFRFRSKEGERAAYLPGRSLRAMSVVLVPCVVILGFDLVIDAIAAPVWASIKERQPPHDELVRITGEQWAWRFTYAGPDGRLDTEDDIESLNEMHVPVNKVLRFELGSRDVLHSFFVPELRTKQDAVPGRTISGWFEPTVPGTFEIICAEICGFGHTMMKGALTVETEEEYQSWLTAQKAAQVGSG
jgi:cytochrome c oxidase subunit 2